MFFNLFLIFMKKYNWMYLLILFISPIFLLFMNNYYSMWIFMELNLLLFIVLVIMNGINISDISMKYYLLNSFSSMIFLFFVNLNMLINDFNYLLIMNLMMLMKLGVFPFHFWFIDMLIQMDWILCFILITWQKFIPMIIIINIYMENLLLMMSLMGGLFSIMMIFNQILLKKMLGYSSLNHMSWMMISLMINFNLWLIYYFSYMFINFIIMLLFWKFNMEEINYLYMYMKNMNYKFYLLMLMLSLGGIPPLYGFFMKWFFIMELVNLMNWLIIIMLIFYSLIFLYYYLRLSFNFMMLYYLSMNLNFYKNFLFKEKNYGIFILMKMFIMINLLLFFMW